MKFGLFEKNIHTFKATTISNTFECVSDSIVQGIFGLYYLWPWLSMPVMEDSSPFCPSSLLELVIFQQ